MKDKLMSVSVVLLSSFLLIGCTDKETDDVGITDNMDTQIIVDQDDTTVDEDIVVDEDIDDDISPDVDDETNTDDVVLEGFSQTKQTLGVATTENAYDLLSMDKTASESYYRVKILFDYSDEGEIDSLSEIPYISAEYNTSKGAIVLRVEQVATDSSGIAIMKSFDINKNGITKIYHAVSGTPGIAIYEIGLSKKTDFKLSVDSSDEQTVYLDIKYPDSSGETVVSDGKNEEFTTTKQSVAGGDNTNGAGITKFSWLSSGGILTIVYEVKGDATEPTPEVYAQYNSDGELTLVFPDLKYPTSKVNKSYSVTGAGTVDLEISDTTSTYVFGEIENKPFRLNRSLNPNQIVFEIKIR